MLLDFFYDGLILLRGWSLFAFTTTGAWGREEVYTTSRVLTCSNPSIIDPVGSLSPDLFRRSKIADLQLFLLRHETLVSRGAGFRF